MKNLGLIFNNVFKDNVMCNLQKFWNLLKPRNELLSFENILGKIVIMENKNYDFFHNY
jgi:hypothetical protein